MNEMIRMIYWYTLHCGAPETICVECCEGMVRIAYRKDLDISHWFGSVVYGVEEWFDSIKYIGLPNG